MEVNDSEFDAGKERMMTREFTMTNPISKNKSGRGDDDSVDERNLHELTGINEVQVNSGGNGREGGGSAVA
ncbi:hypothetical protein Nepgr_008737 [Nepenthes gracilis]|uniref:Uncharacterized protein n=1 Tax=Nepenthes gracilis TaxID=150966 RepID=A0AAD3XJI4_NEPGR|nr:hypothetical protein Nepgr_008737 [Nepenthes gracilis]